MGWKLSVAEYGILATATGIFAAFNGAKSVEEAVVVGGFTASGAVVAQFLTGLFMGAVGIEPPPNHRPLGATLAFVAATIGGLGAAGGYELAYPYYESPEFRQKANHYAGQTVIVVARIAAAVAASSDHHHH